MSKTNGDAAALALGKALSESMAEVVRPLEDKIDNLSQRVGNLEDGMGKLSVDLNTVSRRLGNLEESYRGKSLHGASLK